VLLRELFVENVPFPGAPPLPAVKDIADPGVTVVVVSITRPPPPPPPKSVPPPPPPPTTRIFTSLTPAGAVHVEVIVNVESEALKVRTQKFPEVDAV
jgi:hypothetical protein